MGDEARNLDYLFVLKALDEIPFGVGRRLLIDFLQGKKTNESIARNRLHLKKSFASMAYSKDEINSLIDNLLMNGLIQLTSINGNKFWKVLELTAKGGREISNPSLYKKKLAFNFRETRTMITEEDKLLFDALAGFLHEFNDGQKKSTTSNKKHILCIAGAGTGKTTVLTKRVEFLVNYRSADPRRILAITFTRKARQEMIRRLSGIGHLNLVRIETFNSFCEGILRLYNNLVYDQPVRVVNYRDRVMMINKALSKLNSNINGVINLYFSYAQRRGKTDEQLAHMFMNDCFFIRDYFKFRNQQIEHSSLNVFDKTQEKIADLVFGVSNYIEAYMKKHGLRDFSDQLIDTINLLDEHKELIPEFDHVLIDEYQDVNSSQIRLVDILSPENLFCVGDPRQSIFGWRGSDIGYILRFEEKYNDCDIITLKKNYRSTKHIVELINSSIRNMGLADLESALGGEKDIKLLGFSSELAEFEFVIQCILASRTPRNEIFVLARTNRQLNELSEIMKSRGIKHVVRSDEIRKKPVIRENHVTLATVHAIKGMEAEMVFVVGCNSINFPCKGTEHPVIEMVKMDEYDKEEEERRLFYVAMSRAKKSLYLTYSGRRPTNFITKEMWNILEERQVGLEPKANIKGNKLSANLITRLHPPRF